jgi:hypothetical protein
MTSLNAEAEVLKSDERGRVRVPVGRREALLDEFEASGMSGARFARMAGVNYATFANWAAKRRKLRREAGAGNASSGMSGVRLMEAVVSGEPAQTTASSCGLQIQLPGGVRMQVDSPMQLRMAAELLRMLTPTVRSGC